VRALAHVLLGSRAAAGRSWRNRVLHLSDGWTFAMWTRRKKRTTRTTTRMMREVDKDEGRVAERR